MKNFKRAFIAAAAALLLAFSLTGCKDGFFGGRGSSHKLKFLHIWPEHGVAMSALVNDFMLENPGIEVEIIESNYQDVDNTLRNLVGTSDMPDVFFQWTHYMYKWVPDAVPLDISDIALELSRDFVADGTPIEFGNVGSKYYNIPFRITGYAVIYNKTLFDSNADLSVPETLEELEALLPVLQSKSVTPLACYGDKTGTMMQFNTAFNVFCAIMNGTVEDPAYRTSRLEPDGSDDGAYAILKTKKWKNQNYFGNYSSREAVQQAFMSGRAGMALLNNNEINQLKEGMAGNAEIGIFAIPAPAQIAGGVRYVYGGFDGFSISRTSNKIEAAKKLIRYLASKEAQQKFGNSESSCMVNKNVEYGDPDMEKIAAQMSFVGKYDVSADFNAGEAGDKTAQALVNFLNGGDSSLTGAVSLMNGNVAEIGKALADRLLNPPSGLSWIPRTVTPQPFNRDWLTVGLGG